MTAGPASAGPAWRLGRLLQAPHRLAFSAAACTLALSALWWAAVNLAAAQGQAIRWSLPPAVVHSLLMTFGFMPMFFAGFLFTAAPKWLGRPPVRAAALVSPLLAQLAGWLVFVLAAHGRHPEFGQSLGAIGLAAVAVGWLGIVQRFVALLKASTVADRLHLQLVAAAAAYGVAALCAAVGGLAVGDFALVRAAALSSLWAFVGLVFATVAHRMIPFFSAAAVPALDRWRPQWLLACLVGVFAFEAGAAAAGALAAGPQWPAWQAVRAAVELVAGTAFIALAVRWSLVQNLRNRLLAMLHIGFSWLGIALLMSGVSQAVEAATGSPSGVGLAALHAYTMGFLGSTMFAMVSRVSCGHGGRTLVADTFLWRLFWVLQFAVVGRVAAAVLRDSPAWATALVSAAALGWAGVCIAWAARYGRWYGLPRPDGRAG